MKKLAKYCIFPVMFAVVLWAVGMAGKATYKPEPASYATFDVKVPSKCMLRTLIRTNGQLHTRMAVTDFINLERFLSVCAGGKQSLFGFSPTSMLEPK